MFPIAWRGIAAAPGNFRVNVKHPPHGELRGIPGNLKKSGKTAASGGKNTGVTVFRSAAGPPAQTRTRTAFAIDVRLGTKPISMSNERSTECQTTRFVRPFDCSERSFQIRRARSHSKRRLPNISPFALEAVRRNVWKLPLDRTSRNSGNEQPRCPDTEKLRDAIARG